MLRHRRQLVLLPVLCLLWAGAAGARGGGGCLEADTPVVTPDGMCPIGSLAPAQEVVRLRNGAPVTGHVQAVFVVHPCEAFELNVGGHVVRCTATHLFESGAGRFIEAERLHVGDTVDVWDGARARPAPIESIRRVATSAAFRDLLVDSGGAFIANGIVTHNKGCFLPDTPILKADGSETAISRVQPGDELMAFSPEGNVVTARVDNVLQHEETAYLEIEAENVILRVTEEHPFYVGEGAFQTACTLRPGDTVYAYDGTGLAAQRILSIKCVSAPVTVYNLQTDEPHTFFASGIAVHNKGGGCFLSDTPVCTAAGTAKPLGDIVPGDALLAFTQDRRLVTTHVRRIFAHRVDRYLEVKTERAVLYVTPDHPFGLGGGGFECVGELKSGDSLLAFGGSGLSRQRIERIRVVSVSGVVFNLETDAPHTFFAGGIGVHNKGGSHSHSSSHGGSHHVGGGAQRQNFSPVALLICLGVPILAFLVLRFGSTLQRKNQNLDFVYSTSSVAPKADKTRKLLEFIAKTDAVFESGALEATAQEVFVKLQECWESRDYAPMKPLLMPYLYDQHCKQIAGMKSQHEINKIGDLKIHSVLIVNLRYTNDSNQREFTALITASACDCYVDDRTGLFLRGDTAAAQFQEFWTFQRQGNTWLLRDIEQSRESSALKEENFFEPFTDGNVNAVYGEMAPKTGHAGPWVESDVATKETRIDRLLMFLVKTDGPIWDRTSMLDRVRAVFLGVMTARQSGLPQSVRVDDFFPETGRALVAELERRQRDGMSEEYRNLCIRKVDLVLVRNYADNTARPRPQPK